MVEVERNPLAVRQGAATIMCLAAAAVAMPVIADRAAAQREGAEWAMRSSAFQAELQQQLVQGAVIEPDVRVELTAFHGGDGLRARGRAAMFESPDARAMMLQAVLRGPSAAPGAPEAPRQAEQTAVNPREHNCLSQAIYYEARGETQRGQVAVAEVVMNRTRSSAYPNTICEVVYQGHTRATGCQFTFTCDGSLRQRPRGRAWDRAQRTATAMMLGYHRPITQNATHYHTHEVNPVWNSGLVETTNIGSHVFYRFPNRAERATYQQALAERRAASRRYIVPRADEEAASPDVELDAAAEVTDAAAIVTAPAPADQPAPAAPAATDTEA
ncbi:MAG TPA: cell wall hydrolase [Terricaulis sp.]|nr:cell wall hydrolase [Terricaulis sp.]